MLGQRGRKSVNKYSMNFKKHYIKKNITSSESSLIDFHLQWWLFNHEDSSSCDPTLLHKFCFVLF